MNKVSAYALLSVTWIGISLFYWPASFGPGPSLAQPFVESTELSVQEVRLSQTDTQRVVVFRFSQPPDFVHAFVLSSPARVVIDVGGTIKRSAPATYPASDTLITRVRVGSHPQHTRFVLDLSTDQLPPFSVEQMESLVAVVLGEGVATGEDTPVPQQSAPQILFARAPPMAARPQPSGTAQDPVRALPTPTALTKKSTPLQKPPPPVAPPPSLPSRLLTEKPSPRTTPSRSTHTRSFDEGRAAVPLKPPPPAALKSQPATRSQAEQPVQAVSVTAAQHLRRGSALYNEGNIEGAIRQWKKARELVPTNAEANYRIGLALQQRGELTQAVDAFREAVRLNPTDASLHVYHARALEVQGETQAALAAYRAALQLAPDSAHIHNRVGHLLTAAGNTQGAVKAWQQTIRLQPDYAYAYVNLGEALEQLGQRGEALAAYERAVQLDPRAPFVSQVRQQITRLRTAEL